MSAVPAFQAVRVVVELGAVVWAALWGWQTGSGPARWLLAAACAAAVLACWGRYVAPKSPARLDDPARLAVETLLFVAVAVAAAQVSSPAVGAGFAVLAVGDALGLRVAERRRRPANLPTPASEDGS